MVKPLSRWFFCFFTWVLFSSGLQAQKTFPQNGVYDERDGLFAFTNATIQKSWNEKLEKATLLIRNGRVEAVGVGLSVPADAVVIDCQGKFITPSFIEPFANYGMPEPKAEGAPNRQGQPLSNKKGAFSWNEALKTEFRAHENFVVNPKEAEAWRAVGFGTLLTHRMDGLSRGSATAVSTADDREHNLIYQSVAAHVLSFNKGTSTQSYPSSLMGGIALMRQTYLDGLWHASQGLKEEANYSLEAWNALQTVPQIFAVSDKLEALRAVKIANEFGKKYIIKGNGDEYQRLSDLKATGAAFILPLSFPQAMDVEDPFDALQVSITDLKHWELAPTNPARLAKEGIEFCFTTFGLRDRKEFFAQLQKAMDNGLSEADALKALTATPAKLLNLNDLGSLEKGKWANFLITDKSPLAKDAKIFHNWVQGKGYVLADMNKPVIKGTFSFDWGSNSYKMLQITGSEAQLFKNDTAKTRVVLTQDLSKVTLTFTPVGEKDVVRLSGVYEGGVMKGRGQLADGTWINWSAAPMAFAAEGDKAAASNAPKADIAAKGDVIYPFAAFGRKELPKAETVLFKNATVWTGEKEGILKETDVLIENGKIAKIGKNLTAAGAKTVDATGKHLTAGIIDEHSHVAMSKGTNEGTQASSAEVRVGDIINSDDVNIYRQLAGGVTSSHILHGSANPIGGQTQLIKFRWGYSPEKMKFEKWDQFIKFALGENVKQSSRAPDNFATARFPQTRMGVEQVYDDYFTRAAEYAQLRKSGKPYRKDLDLECVADILEEKCFITCHSYVQSEINMLMKVAERHKFKVNTFTHILEGYKVADKMKQHGVGAAGFADWWDYKYEVYEAIPQSPSMMNNQGVLTAINSDDAEMARRLNQEAAKTLMYGGMKDEATIWNFVTLNPAKMLHVDNRVGSIKVGKDADVVLWNTTPLSIYAKSEQTYVDGIKFFDREEDLQLRADMQKERARLIQKMLQVKKAGGPTQPVQARTQRAYECEDDEDEMRD